MFISPLPRLQPEKTSAARSSIFAYPARAPAVEALHNLPAVEALHNLLTPAVEALHNPPARGAVAGHPQRQTARTGTRHRTKLLTTFTGSVHASIRPGLCEPARASLLSTRILHGPLNRK